MAVWVLIEFRPNYKVLRTACVIKVAGSIVFEWFGKEPGIWLKSNLMLRGSKVRIPGPGAVNLERALFKMHRTKTCFSLFVLAVAAVAAGAATEEKSKFLVFEDLGKERGELKTSIVTYRDKAGVEVSLVSAVHVGDKKYYDQLKEDFTRYDALLYEMIKPEGVNPSERGKEGGGSIISFFQRGMKTALGLEFQLDGIDYSKDNFVHADMDPETFFRLQKKKGEGIIQLMLKSMQAEMKRQQKSKARAPGLLDIIRAFAGKDSARSLKYLFARQMEGMEDIMAGFEGDGESVIVGERNKVCIEVLKKEIKAGKKKIGIFYGAAHMPDMEERLVKELGFSQLGEVKWVTAWDIREKKPAGKEGAEPSREAPRRERL